MDIHVSLLLLMLMVVSAKADSKDKNNCVHVDQNGRQKKFEVSCEEEGAVISNITVSSGTGSCSGNAGCCVGESPNLIVESLNCFWKHNCSISFPRDIIIKSDYECPNCIGMQPKFMLINQTKCFTPKNTDGKVEQDKIDICENLNPNKESSDVSMDSGLLLSHKNYPWEYEPSKMISPQDPSRTCNKTFWLNADTKFLVSVYKIDVAEGDSLWVKTNTSSKEIRNEISMVFNDYQTRYVAFVFNVVQESNGGMGFVLCFKMVPIREYNPDMNACDIVMSRNAAVKVTEADADCTRTWWGCPTPSPTPPPTTGKKCSRKDRKAKKCSNRKKKRGPRKNKNKKKDRKKKKQKRNGSKSSKQRRSRKQSRNKSS